MNALRLLVFPPAPPGTPWPPAPAPPPSEQCLGTTTELKRVASHSLHISQRQQNTMVDSKQDRFKHDLLTEDVGADTIFREI